MNRFCRIACAFLSALLFFSSAPQLSSLHAETHAYAEVIPALLAAGTYNSGQAIALVRGGTVLGEVLAEVSSVAVCDTIDAALSSGSEAAAAAKEKLGSNTDTGFTIQLVKDPSFTEEQLLERLFHNPDVITAEPNYHLEAAKPVSVNNRINEAADNTQSDSNPGDLTILQWSLSDEEGRYTTPLSPTSSYRLHVPGWTEGHLDPSAPANSSGTVCVMDTGIDVNHPDLQNVMYEFSPQQMEAYGCGRHGLNTSGDGDPGDLSDHHSHGTHVAGIIAAEWNNQGISGIANGIKLFGVKIFGNDGMRSDEAACVSGFRFLINAAKDVNLKAVNCSWGYLNPQLINNVLINELGKNGVTTVFASGNRSLNADENMDSGVSVTSPYAIVVNGASMDGQLADYSCWGQTSTDLFAPGSSVISSLPLQIENRTDVDTLMSFSRFELFYPEATDQKNLIYGIDRFDKDSRVRFFDKNPALHTDAKEIGTEDNTAGFDDKHSMAFDIPSLSDTSSLLNSDMPAAGGSVYLAIPADSAEEVNYIFAQCAVDHYKVFGGIASVTYAGPDGAPVEVDNHVMNAVKTGWASSSNYTIYECQWTPLSYNVSGFLEASQTAHSMNNEQREEIGLFDYEDPGELSGLYAWKDQDQTYVIAEIGLSENDPTASVVPETLYIDQIALGNSDAWTGSYHLLSGTSMAAPAVTGSLAVIAKEEPETASLSEADCAELALARTAKLLASVKYDERLKTLCRTGGRLDLAENEGFVKKAPLIERADCDGQTLTVAGYFFSDQGTIRIDGQEVKPDSWTDTAITVQLDSAANGSHIAEIINQDNAVSQVMFHVSDMTAANRPRFETVLSMPADVQFDRLCGPMTEWNNHLYVFNLNLQQNITALWDYDISSDSWTTCAALPEGLLNATISGMSCLKGTIYVSAGTDEDSPKLWTYDIAAGSWDSFSYDGPFNTSIAVYDDKLILIGGTYPYNEENLSSPSDFSVFDPADKSLTRLPFTFDNEFIEPSEICPAVTDTCIYAYCPSNGMSEENTVGALYRIRYNGVNTPEAEDLTAELERIASSKTQNGQITICGFSNGIMIIGSDFHGQDTHILYDDQTSTVPYDRTLSYHYNYKPASVSVGNDIYAIGYSTTENDLMMFRKTTVDHTLHAYRDKRDERKQKQENRKHTRP